MPLLAVQLEDLRCLRNVDLRLDPKLTLITGPNASGKTSLLEGIFFLGRGRSFRTRQLDRVVRSGSDALTVVGHLSSDRRPVVIGLRATRDSIEARIGGQPVESLSALATAFPVQVIDPNLHKLIEEGPAARRRTMDWGVFHVEHAFATDWQRYQRALRQRNAALRAGQPACRRACLGSGASVFRHINFCRPIRVRRHIGAGPPEDCALASRFGRNRHADSRLGE